MSSSANGDGPIDLLPPIRDIEKIVQAHDLLKYIITGQIEEFTLDHLSDGHRTEIEASSAVLCWILQDGNEGEFGEKIEDLEITLNGLGYHFEGAN